MSSNKALEPDVDYLKAVVELSRIAKPVTFTPTPLTKKSKFLEMFKLIPGLAEFVGKFDESGENISLLIQLKENISRAAHTAEASFHWIRLGLAIVNFIRIPAIFLTAALLGQKVPFTLSKTGQWVYATTLLALTALAIALPPIAPFMILAASGVVLGSSLFTLGRLLYQRYQIKKELKNITKQIDEEMEDLNQLRSQAHQLREDLKHATEDDEKVKLLKAIEALKQSYDSRYQSIQALYDKKGLYEYKLAKRDNIAILDKLVASFLAAGLFSGLVVAIFFPPVGLAISIACAAAGGTYLLGRFIGSFLSKQSGLKVSTQTDNKEQAEAVTDYAENEDKLEEKLNETKAPRLDHLPPTLDDSEMLMELALGVTPEQTEQHKIHNQLSAEDELSTSTDIPSLYRKREAPKKEPAPLIEDEERDGDGEIIHPKRT
ncbi:coiled-coil protein [Legionella beliardensis]|uniref:Coiled-coil protein n=1 Tax=Legionella beliardensis TaxID=91822 RepID=A0A378I5U7_9GAMM|nr:hypothetical protein [Legionella beliardensis]STX30105.1 coiled-coil protein [Legionella beliardensis]